MEYTLTTSTIDSLREWALMQNKQTKTPQAERFWLEEHDDMLFWCFYICRFGINAYARATITKSDVKSIETTVKSECARDFAENKELRARVKSLKLDSLKHTAQQLSPCEQISIQTFFIICVMYDVCPGLIYESANGAVSMMHLPESSPTHHIYITNRGCACILEAEDALIQRATTQMVPIKKALRN